MKKMDYKQVDPLWFGFNLYYSNNNNYSDDDLKKDKLSTCNNGVQEGSVARWQLKQRSKTPKSMHDSLLKCY